MKQFPPLPEIDDAPSGLLAEGHLWTAELVDGGPLRFRLAGGGIEFGDRDGAFGPEVPPPYRLAAVHVRAELDRAALSAAAPDVDEVVLFGVSTHRRRVDYEFDRLPPFLGTDVWTGDRYLPPDGVERTFERLGLEPINTFDRELRARDFDPEAYGFPESAWYDGPAAGVVVRNKRGGRGLIPNPPVVGGDADGPLAVTAGELADSRLRDARLERIADDLRDRGRPAGFDAVYERAVAEAYREVGDRLPDGFDREAFRAAAAERTNRFLGR